MAERSETRSRTKQCYLQSIERLRNTWLTPVKSQVSGVSGDKERKGEKDAITVYE